MRTEAAVVRAAVVRAAVLRATGAVAAVALLGGCGGSGAPAAGDTPPPVPVAPSTAATVLAGAVKLLRADGTGAFDAVTTSTAAGLLSTRQVGGRFDLARDLWAATMDTHVTAVGNPNVATYKAKLAGRDKTLFVNVGKGAKGVKLSSGQWYRAATAGLPLAADDLSLVHVLGRVKATELRTTVTGARVVDGTLPAADAVRLLGLTPETRRLKVDPKVLTGNAPVTVHLDAEGRLTRLRLAGDQVRFTGKVPLVFRDLVRGTSYSQVFRALGDPVEIALPKSAKQAAGALAVAARNVL